MSLNLSPLAESILEQEASRIGISVDELIHRTFAPHIPRPDKRAVNLIEAIHQWQAEDRTEDENELIRRDLERIQLQTNLNTVRQQCGMQPLFPDRE